MNQSQCVFCSRNDVALTLLGSGKVCSSCLVIAHNLVHIERFTPDNKLEEIFLSLIFFLESDLVFTRQVLNAQSLNDSQMIIKKKREKLQGIVTNYKGVDERYINKVEMLINEHSVLLDLYTN